VNKADQYATVMRRLRGLLAGERDEIALMATVVCELHHGLDHFDWTGFYRVAQPGLLKIGPYQGGHGCLTIPFERGVCGQCAREKATQLVPDVTRLPYHIACSSSTRSEIVVPVFDAGGRVRAVLDVDSDTADAFDALDAARLEEICRWLIQAPPV
jgi:L-methionine (R)-S-oxide reductase